MTHRAYDYNSVGEWRSSEAHLAGGQGVAGSNPASPTLLLARIQPNGLDDQRL